MWCFYFQINKSYLKKYILTFIIEMYEMNYIFKHTYN
jgi:hypothetical protein